MYISPTITVELKRRVPTDLFTEENSPTAIFEIGEQDISSRVVRYPDIELKTSDAEGTLFQYNQSYYTLEVDNKDGYFNSDENSSSIFNSVMEGLFDGRSIYTLYGSQIILTVNTGDTNQIKCTFLIETLEHQTEGLDTRVVLILKRPHYDFLNTTFQADFGERAVDTRRGRTISKVPLANPFTNILEVLGSKDEHANYTLAPFTGIRNDAIAFVTLPYYYGNLLSIEVEQTRNTPTRLGLTLMVYTAILNNRRKVDELIRYATIAGLILSDSVDDSGNTVLRYTPRERKAGSLPMYNYLPVEDTNILRIDNILVNDTSLYAPRFEFRVPDVTAVLRDFEFTADAYVITANEVSEYVESIFTNTFYFRQINRDGRGYQHSFANFVLYSTNDASFDLEPTSIVILGSENANLGEGTALLITGYSYYPDNFYLSVENRTAVSIESVTIDMTHIFPIARVGQSVQAPTTRLKTRLLNLISPAIDVTDLNSTALEREVPLITDATQILGNRGGIALWLNQNYGNPKKLYNITLVLSSETVGIRPMDGLNLRSSVANNANESLNFNDTILVLSVRFDINAFEVHILGEVI